MTRPMYVLCAWIAAHAAAVAVIAVVIGGSGVGSAGMLFALGLLALVSVVAMFQRVNLTAATTAGAVITYVTARALQTANSGTPDVALYMPDVSAGAIGLVVVAVVSDLIGQSIWKLEGEFAAGRRALRELERIDPATGLHRSRYGLELVGDEVARAAHHGRDCSLVLLGPDQWEEAREAHPDITDEELMRRLSEVYRARLGVSDCLIEHGDDILVLVVETGAERAEVVAAQLCEEARSVIATPVRAGVASFPVSEVTAEGLIAEAEASLSFARAARVPVAGPELLQS